MPDLGPVHAALRELMAPYAARLDIKRDDATELYVDTRHLQPNGKPLFFGAVQLRKSQVAFHLMPVYLAPALLASLSPGLRARLHGKSCFHFSAVDPALFDELAALTAAGYAHYEALGYV